MVLQVILRLATPTPRYIHFFIFKMAVPASSFSEDVAKTLETVYLYIRYL